MAYERRDGEGVMFANDKKNDRQPDWRGELKLNGKDYEVVAWKRRTTRGEEMLSLKAEEKRQPSLAKGNDDGDMPF